MGYRAETLNLITGLPISRSRQQFRTGAGFKNSYLTILLAYNGVYISNKCFFKLLYCLYEPIYYHYSSVKSVLDYSNLKKISF